MKFAVGEKQRKKTEKSLRMQTKNKINFQPTKNPPKSNVRLLANTCIFS